MVNNVSAHFTMDEVINSPRGKELGIDNELPPIYYTNVINTAIYLLEPIRAYFNKPFSPTSWYRCPELNKAVGGSKTSDHMIGAAVDISVPTVSLMDLALYIRDNLLFDQVILEKSWVHVSFKKDDNRKQALRNVNGKYLEGLV